ncbi:hypothetical protein PoB_004569800 [Plakobranchus ocellatus]|uniref:Uncharacterized protein n=1 Tax=Plakobranchus ocellatus TaxID=259542 RepID=A0AAV4BHV2_9GAST|nr:hypothetical protein PoB_004569800 [Plakobranchus ocellatus]
MPSLSGQFDLSMIHELGASALALPRQHSTLSVPRDSTRHIYPPNQRGALWCNAAFCSTTQVLCSWQADEKN